jgi:zinc transporter 1/2/3
MDIKYIAVIFVFLSSIAGFGVSKLISSKKLAIFFKLFSAGVILSLSVVHIIPEVIRDNAYEYPLGSSLFISGIFIMGIIDSLSHTFISSHSHLSDHENQTHNHSCVTTEQMQKKVNPYIFELACVFHSILIGITLGTQSDENITPLIISIVFHQFIEGTSLGWIIDIVNKIPKICMITIYALSTPLGIIIGMTLYNSEDMQWKIASNCLLGFSGGLLLYISLVQIYIEEINKDELHKRVNLKTKLMLHMSFFIGMALMNMLAIWV